jgi:hypothetical protein
MLFFDRLLGALRLLLQPPAKLHSTEAGDTHVALFQQPMAQSRGGERAEQLFGRRPARHAPAHRQR